MKVRLYVVQNKISGEVHLVESPNKTAARNYISQKTLDCYIPNGREIGDLTLKGVRIEVVFPQHPLGDTPGKEVDHA
jgi:hypothetical protein